MEQTESQNLLLPCLIYALVKTHPNAHQNILELSQTTSTTYKARRMLLYSFPVHFVSLNHFKTAWVFVCVCTIYLRTSCSRALIQPLGQVVKPTSFWEPAMADS